MDGAGNAYVTGYTSSTDFPTVNARYPNREGWMYGFLTKFDPQGQGPVYSTYLGTSGYVAVDKAGNVYVTAEVGGASYPNCKGGGGDAAVTKFDPQGQGPVYSTCLGGSDYDLVYGIAVDGAGNAYVTGETRSDDFPMVNARYPNKGGWRDGFVTKFDSQGQAPVYSTYLGGSEWDYGYGIAIDSAGNAYVTGATSSTDFPAVNALYPNYGGGNQDAFVTKFDSKGQGPIYSTYFGGSSRDFNDAGCGIAVDGPGNAYVTGCSDSTAFVIKLNPQGLGPVYSTYLDGNMYDCGAGIAVDGTGKAYVAGRTYSDDFPTVNARYPHLMGSWDTFVTKIADTGLPSDGPVVDLQVLDAIDFRSGATISSDPITLGDRGKGHSMNGVATDGLAQLVLRARTNHPGTVTFSIAGADGGATGNPAEDGQLLSRDGSQPGNNTLAVVAEPIAYRPGEYYAFARYLAPETFPRASVPADLSAAQRPLRLRVQFAPSDGTPPPAQPLDRLLTLARPPVVLIHGFASSSETWNTFIAKLRQRIPGIAVDADVGDYRYSNLAHFSVNGPVPAAAVIRARKAYQDRGLATIQADVFGHSMGGVLSRIAASSGWYKNDSNYRLGYFHKLVTVDSPHHGSAWADLLWASLSRPVGNGIEKLLGIPSAQYLGAIEDLRTNSGPLCAMLKQPTDLRAHVIVGDYTPTVNDLADIACLANEAISEPTLVGVCQVWGLVKAAGFDTRVSTNFPLGGDLIVGVESQRDGFADGATQVSERDHIHMAFADRPAALETDAVANRAVELLNASSADGALFGGGFPISACPEQSTSSNLQRNAAVAPAAAPGGLKFTAPADGSTVTPGQVVTVTAQTDAGVNLTTLMLISLGDVQQRATPPWEFVLTIPATAVGPFGVALLGKDAAGTFYGAELTLNVVPASPLQTLSVSPANVFITDAGLPQSLAVTGNYADGTQRDLTAPRTGTTYASQDPAVADFDADGRVTAVSNGTTTITVANGTATGTVVVVVQMETDVGIHQTPAPSPVEPGTDLTYTIAVTNLGSAAAREVRVDDHLATDSLFISASGAGWGCIEAGGVVSCSRESLAAGATAPLDLVVNTPPSCNSLINQVAVNASTPDGNADNNVSVIATPCGAPTNTLTVIRDGPGSGVVSGPGIQCGTDCTETYPASPVVTVTLTATPSAGSSFDGWTGCTPVAGLPTHCTVAMATTTQVTAQFGVAPVAVANRIRITGLTGTVGEMQYYALTLPNGASDLVIATSGGTDNADLYVRQGTWPTLTDYDCRSASDGNAETCTVPTPAAGTWTIGLYAQVPYAGVSLSARYADGGACAIDADLILQNNTIAGAVTETACHSIVAGPALTVSAGGELRLRAGARIGLRPGFRVQAGGRCGAAIDRSLAP